jgi:hypothetical protein
MLCLCVTEKRMNYEWYMAFRWCGGTLNVLLRLGDGQHESRALLGCCFFPSGSVSIPLLG